MDDPQTIMRRRLIWRAWHRGTREMDFLLGGFADRHVAGFDAEALAEFERVLELPDPDLYAWKTGAETPPEEAMGPILALFLAEDEKAQGPR